MPSNTPTATNTPAAVTPTPTNTHHRGFEGCSGAFWKNNLDEWEGSGFSPDQRLNTVFAGTGSLGSDTLLQALRYGAGPGTLGGKRILLRAAVAALLNSAELNYPLSEQQVVDYTNSALQSNHRFVMFTLAFIFDFLNNHGHCPGLNEHEGGDDS